MTACEQELCPMWAGDSGCPCAVLDIEPPIERTTCSDCGCHVEHHNGDHVVAVLGPCSSCGDCEGLR